MAAAITAAAQPPSQPHAPHARQLQLHVGQQQGEVVGGGLAAPTEDVGHYHDLRRGQGAGFSCCALPHWLALGGQEAAAAGAIGEPQHRWLALSAPALEQSRTAVSMVAAQATATISRLKTRLRIGRGGGETGG